MQLTIVRHTRVDVPKGICYGNTDVPLAATYEEDMRQVTDKLRGETFDAVYSSPLTRCRLLAEKICPDADIQTDGRLMELNFGKWEMTAWETVYATEEGKSWFADFLRAPCPNGGSYTEMEQNVISFLDELKGKKYQNVLIVTHAGVIRTFDSILNNKTPEESFSSLLEYGAVLRFNLNVT